MNVELTGKHLIDGHWRSARPAAFTATNPATGQTLSPPIAEATREEVDCALSAARQAFEQTSTLPAGWAGPLLDEIANQLMRLGQQLVSVAGEETALPEARLVNERVRTCNQLRMFAALLREGSWVDATIDLPDPKRVPQPRPDIRRMNRPLGPIAVFGASNFPFAFGAVGGDTASALAAGNPVIVKGHPGHPRTSELMAAAVQAAMHERDLPTGLFQLLQGRQPALSETLVQHPRTAAVGFTGSLHVGRSLFNIAAARPRPIPLFAEMGSLNPLIVTAAAIAERGPAIAQGLTGSILLGAGQFCTKPGLVLIVSPAQHQTAFIAALSEALSAASAMTMLNQSLRNNFAQRLAPLSEIAGVKQLVCGSSTGFAATGACLYQTTADVWLREPRLREEAFGPAAVIVHCALPADAIAVLASVEGSLTGSLHIGANEKESAAQLLAAIQNIAGRVIVNGYPTGVEVNHAMVHGGPYPATTAPATTSVGTAAMLRFVRPVAYQDLPDSLLPAALQNANPLGIERMVDGRRTRAPISILKEPAA